jgi:hypothetical protein
MRKLKALGNFLTIIGIIIIFASTILPLVKLPQTYVKRGPSVKLDETTQYWIDTSILPNIDKGTPFSVDLVGGHSGGLGITILPFRDGAVIAGASPLINQIFTADQQRFTASANTSIFSEYLVSIVSIRNNYTLTINSRWSPFDSFRAYTYLGLSALPAGLLIIYYDNILEKRDRLFKNLS